MSDHSDRHLPPFLVSMKMPKTVCDATTPQEAIAQVVATLTQWSCLAEENAFARPTTPGKMDAAAEAALLHFAAWYFSTWVFLPDGSPP